MAVAQTTDIDAMLKMYELLRDEITQSNQLQQRIVLGLATFVGLVFSLVFSGAIASFEAYSPISLALVITAVLPIIGSSAGIWLVEQSRVMMAGNYLQLLEYKIHQRVGNAPMSWENWLRRDPEDLPSGVGASGDGEWNDPQDAYDMAYRVGYLAFFVVLGSMSILLYVNELVIEGSIDFTDPSFIEFLKLLWPVLWFLFFVLFAAYARQVISHGTQNMDETVVTGWEQHAFDSGVTLSDAFEEYAELVDNVEFETTTPEDRFRELLEMAGEE